MGPLSGIKVIELASIGPGPFCGMMLADMGAEVIRVDRPSSGRQPARASKDVLARGRRSIAVNLKKPEGIDLVLSMLETTDVFFEGFRPGVAERLGLGPEDCLARNPKLVYGRMTGWGQTGPLAHAAGHDINYIALAGALHAIGRENEKPIPPLNLVGDFGGGGMLLAFGITCALLEAKASGKGQVVDAAMVDGTASLLAMFFGMQASGNFRHERGTNLLDGAAHFYDTYKTSDDKYIAIGSIEPQFYKLLVEKSGVDPSQFADQMNPSVWPDLTAALAEVFKTKTRDQWCAIMEGTDVCFAPVLSMEEAPSHPHNKTRATFVNIDGVSQPAPSPRFSRTPPEIQNSARIPGADTREILKQQGMPETTIEGLIKQEVIQVAKT